MAGGKWNCTCSFGSVAKSSFGTPTLVIREATFLSWLSSDFSSRLCLPWGTVDDGSGIWTSALHIGDLEFRASGFGLAQPWEFLSLSDKKKINGNIKN